MKRRLVLGIVVVAVIVAVAIFAGCIEEKSSAPVSTPTPTPTPSPTLTPTLTAAPPTETDENLPPVIDESKFPEVIPISGSEPTKFDLSDKATDPDSPHLTWSTKVVSSTGDPYEHKLIIKIDENNIATITPATETIDNGYILFTVSDGELTDSIERPYALLPKFIPVHINKPEQSKTYTTKSIELDVTADSEKEEIIEYWLNNADFINTPGILYTGPTILTEEDGIKEGENFIISKTKSSPMVSTVSFTIKTAS